MKKTVKNIINKFVGDKAFYKTVLAVAIPIMVQNGISQFVNLLDNLMVGSIGTEQMSGVAICNELIFVFNLCIFGSHAGAGIYGAQFYGKGDIEGVQKVHRFKLWVSLILTALGAALLGLGDEKLISLFLHEGSEQIDLAATLSYGMDYMQLMLIGLLPFSLSQAYASTLRQMQKPKLPMVAGIIAVGVNLIGNYVLINGKLGLPALGVKGAAIATVLSRFVELGIVAGAVHLGKTFRFFTKGLYRSWKVPADLTLSLIRTGLPLMLNEALWSSGQAVLSQQYSLRNLDVVAGHNISITVSNLFFIAALAMGDSLGIVVGNLLGANKFKEAKLTANRMTAFSVALHVLIGVTMWFTADLFPLLYNTTDTVRSIASDMLRVWSLCIPLYAFTNCCYFTLRAGGMAKLTMIFDCGYVWIIAIPVAFFLCNFTSLPITPVYAIISFLEVIKCVVGYAFVHQNKWCQNLVVNE